MTMQEKMTVVSQRPIARNIFELVMHGTITRNMKTPGQFVHIRVGSSNEFMLRRPISICNVNAEEETLTCLYRAEGKGTLALSAARPGDVIDIIAPLGNGFPVTAAQKCALLIGGGIGVPPLYELSKQLNARGIKTIHVLGFQSEADMFYMDAFSALGETHIATVDGSYGTRGFVTDVIKALPVVYDTFYTCGPIVMIKAIEAALPDTPGFMSLEERMGCGIGACYACVCQADNNHGYVKICSDGPVFEKGALVL
ncbi:dihydroorotate dehydrogenase electron transfer subunit [Macrococcus equipercicus]|uniref:Dihydroorotate dehydrogenase B (NAD(+)), electron transfer subunit n=2 Tax=Macrococcus equipercicus TaxID=69967 RepID=A0A9Q9BNL4_9STAP|nr:dihydroorotate dehydrogenase electron transfer subunit [Macrococcus equipercicus]UTH14853.1 dihydroorotate dehydrogenase electron transfer subunit [Macrococcus equipercicus]